MATVTPPSYQADRDQPRSQHPRPAVDVVSDNTHFLALDDQQTGARFTFERRDTDERSHLTFLDVTGEDRCLSGIVLPESVALFLYERGYVLTGTTRLKTVDSPVLTLADLTAP